MVHPDILLQYPYETLEYTYKMSETLKTYACNMSFSPVFPEDAKQSGERPVPAAEDGGPAW